MRSGRKYVCPVLLLSVTLLGFGCTAQTRYAGTPVADLTDVQLVEELVSSLEGLGIEVDRTSYLMAIRPEPAYVLTSSTTTFAGTINATYSGYAMPVGYGTHLSGIVTGTVRGGGRTQYQYTDVNAAARLGNSLALAISQARQQAYRQRGLDVLGEYEWRVLLRRQETERVIFEFFASNPHLQDRNKLVAAVAPWAAAEGYAEGAAVLERAGEIVSNLPSGPGLSGRWYGLFSQTSRLDGGEVFAFSEFVQVALEETEEGRVTGEGLLGSGEVIEFDGELENNRIAAVVANVTSGINVEFSAIPGETQMTGEFAGYGAGQRVSGTVALFR